MSSGKPDARERQGGRQPAEPVAAMEQLQRGVEDEERDPRADENSMGGDQPQLSTTLIASRVTLTSRSISVAVTTSGGAKYTASPGAGCGPGDGRVRVTTPRFIISAWMRWATLRSAPKFRLVARSSTSSTAASSPLPPRMSPAFG